MDLGNDLGVCSIHIKGFQGGRLHKVYSLLLRIAFALINGDCSEMAQVCFVPNEHDNRAALSVVTELLQPSLYVLEGDVSGDVVDKQGTDRASIVCARDCSVPFLACSVPNLGFHDFIIDLNAAGGEFHANGGFRVHAELVAGESGEEVGFSDARISY